MSPSEVQFFVGVFFIACLTFVLWAVGKLLNIWLKSPILEGICYILYLFYFWNSAIIGACIVKQLL